MKETIDKLNQDIKSMIYKGEIEESYQLICNCMLEYPHSAIPHNLMGIILDIKGDQVTALKHFRASYSLDPAFRPARFNIRQYAEFATEHIYIFDEYDCKQIEKKLAD